MQIILTQSIIINIGFFELKFKNNKHKNMKDSFIPDDLQTANESLMKKI